MTSATLPPETTRAPGALNSVLAIERPHAQLMTYYALASLLAGPLFFIPLVPLYFRYHTMRYRFDAEGVSMRWGILFRREVNLTYARIQDIHLTSNLVQRWLGLAMVKVSTASGAASAEMTIEGLLEYEMVRDFLYMKMRGAHERPAAAPAEVSQTARPGAGRDDVVSALRQVSEDLRAVREALERWGRP